MAWYCTNKWHSIVRNIIKVIRSSFIFCVFDYELCPSKMHFFLILIHENQPVIGVWNNFHRDIEDTESEVHYLRFNTRGWRKASGQVNLSCYSWITSLPPSPWVKQPPKRKTLPKPPYHAWIFKRKMNEFHRCVSQKN